MHKFLTLGPSLLLIAFVASACLPKANSNFASETQADFVDEWSLVKRKPFVCRARGEIYIKNNKLSPLSVHNGPLIHSAAKEFAKPFIDSCKEMDTLTVFASSGPMSIGYIILKRSQGWSTPAERSVANRNPHSNRADKSGVSALYRLDKAQQSERARRVQTGTYHRNSKSALCYAISGIAKVAINSGYYTDIGKVYSKNPDKDFDKTPYLHSIPCSSNTEYELDGHKFLISSKMLTRFVGRAAGKPVYTDYEVTTSADICVEIPRLNFFTHLFQSDHNVKVEHPILKNFFIYDSDYWGRFASRLYDIRKHQCIHLSDEELYPKAIRVHIYDDGDNVGWPSEKYVKYAQANEGPFRLLYSGIYLDSAFTPAKWYDDDPIDRYEYNLREKAYQARLAEFARQRRAREAEFYGNIAALAVGFIQGVTLEFADEGLCAFLANVKISSISRVDYVRCHNFLYDAYESLKSNSPEMYLIGNLIGMMNTSFDEFTTSAKSREGEALRVGAAECLEGMTSEYGKVRHGTTPDQKTLLEACKFGFAMGGVKGAVFPGKGS